MFAKIAYGRTGSLFIKAIIIINSFGICCAYFRIFGETASSLVEIFVKDENNFFISNYNNYFYILILSLIMLVLIFRDSIDSLKCASVIGVLAFTIFFISFVVVFIYKFINDLNIPFDYKMLWPDFNKPLNLIGSLPSVFLAFTFQFNAFPIYFSLKKRTNEEMIKATTIGVYFCFMVYLVTGIVGFLMYGYNLDDSILKNFKADILIFNGNDYFLIIMLIILNLSFMISAIMGIPLMFFSLKTNFLNTVIFYKKKNLGNINNSDQTELLDRHSFYNKISEGKSSEKYSLTKRMKNSITFMLYIAIVSITIIVPGLKIVYIIFKLDI